MRLIDADTLMTWFDNHYDDEMVTVGFVSGLIKDEPTIDAVPVIKCKDCKWWTKQEDSLQGRCALHGMYPTGEWFCANARREEE